MAGRLPAGRTVMLERERELAELEAALADARAGVGRVYLVSGDAGIGKTTLVRAVVEAAEPTDVRVRWGRCWEGGGAPAYWPWIQVLSAQVAETDDATLGRQLGPGASDVAQLVPELGPRLGVSDVIPAIGDAQGARFRLFDAVSSYLAQATTDAPLLVILEDLHAADEASLSLLQFVSRPAQDRSLLVIGTYRTPEVQGSPPHLRHLTSVAREGVDLALEGLGRPSVAELLERSSGAAPSEDLAREIHEVTEGNPFFVVQMGRLLGAKLDLRRGRVPLPEAVHAVIGRQLEGCDDKTATVLAAAAVIGREFDLSLLVQLTRQSLDDLLDDLGEAARVGVIEEVALNRWSFVHALIRETLYDRLALRERVRLHHELATALQSVRPEALSEIAHHRFEAARAGSGRDRAAESCIAAGREAAAVVAYGEAAHWYERALEVLELEGGAERRRYDVLVALGDALLRGGSRNEGRRRFLEAVELARSIGDAELLAHAALGFYGVGEEDLDPADQSRDRLIREALSSLPEEDSAVRARLLMSLGNFAVFDPDAYESRTQAALAMARRVGDSATLAEVLWSWHYGHSTPPHLFERLKVADELVALAHDSGSREQLVLAFGWRVFDRFEAGDMSGMRADLRSALTEAEALRLPFPLWGIMDMRAAVETLEGRFGDAERTTNETLVLGRRSRFPIAEVKHAIQIVFLRWVQGRFDEMAARAQDAADRFPAIYLTLPLLHAIALAELGHREEARLELERILAEGDWSGYGRTHRESSAALLTELCSLLGDPGPCQPLLDVLAPFAGRHLVVGIMSFSMGAVDRSLGLLATLQGRFDEADAHFEAAHRLHERLGGPWWLARGLADHARMLFARRRPADDERAMELLARARKVFTALGATVPAERATALLEQRERTVFRLDGDQWTIQFGGTEVRLRDSKGLRYLAHMLARPGEDVHALELAGDRSVGRDGPARRLHELQGEIDDAGAANDLGRLERAENAFDDLVSRLQADTRGPEAERARLSVTRAVKGAIDRVAAGHPALGDHLRSTVHTGVYSAYTPDPRTPVKWET